MKAYKCDICGELFPQPSEITVSGVSGIFWATMHRTTDGSQVDICLDCRFAIVNTIEKPAIEAREREEEAV